MVVTVIMVVVVVVVVVVEVVLVVVVIVYDLQQFGSCTCEPRGQAAAHDRYQASDAVGLAVLRLLLRQLHQSHTARERNHRYPLPQHIYTSGYHSIHDIYVPTIQSVQYSTYIARVPDSR